jgi:uncharacterized protein YcfL
MMRTIITLLTVTLLLLISSCSSSHHSIAKLHDLKLIKRDSKEVATKKIKSTNPYLKAAK